VRDPLAKNRPAHVLFVYMIPGEIPGDTCEKTSLSPIVLENFTVSPIAT
jgi:hypothetical protein